ncbi:isoprenyl transferase [Alkalicoccus urumqiensis]|uniref:Isoprenyl transferase n=1 Tax=Alkalicoccus urumqiensis TaxID=1548213 RepID=A0A2P6MFY2_ALKUR|nr:isoprenyl transferase [Alkalicoccus urumqiensis]PRO65199.1 isoprenyl transferase [Alkalicoccus urumqiensis]
MLNKLTKRMKKEEFQSQSVPDVQGVPSHIAIIMDGNGRWARQRGLPRVAGHREGMTVIRNVVRACNELGVDALTLYAFSTENWKRPKTEVDFLMRLPERFLSVELPKLMEENVIVRITGDTEKLPPFTQRAVENAVHETQQNDGLVLNFALNYGSRSELMEAFQKMHRDIDDGRIAEEDVTEHTVSNYLMTSGMTDPDLLIRTSGEKRLSNFMLWQLAYAEFWFTDVLWPDFTKEHFYEAVEAYQMRKRRYGGV